MAATALARMPWRRIASAAAVLLLHIAVAIFLLRATFAPRRIASTVHETIIYLTQPALPKKKKAAPAKPAPRAATPGALGYRGYFVPQPNGIESGPAMAPLDLLDCRPENLVNLTPEQRARCSAPLPRGVPDYADHTREIPGAARWAREKQRKNGPPLLPCASTQSIFATLSTATLMCLAHGAVDGFDPDNAPMYGDRPEETHIPNNGDPRPVYVDPDH
jgi:hypothetical protein